jgi:N-methylhydantoinase B
MGSDALYVRWNGGGGYGDPLLRSVTEVEKDVVAGLISEKYAKDIYGVVMNGANMEVDEKASEQHRLSILSDRKTNDPGKIKHATVTDT